MVNPHAVNNQQQNDGGGTSGEVEQPGNNPNSNLRRQNIHQLLSVHQRIVNDNHNQRTDGDVLPPPALNGAAEGMAALNIEDEEGALQDGWRAGSLDQMRIPQRVSNIDRIENGNIDRIETSDDSFDDNHTARDSHASLWSNRFSELRAYHAAHAHNSNNSSLLRAWVGRERAADRMEQRMMEEEGSESDGTVPGLIQD